MPTDYFFVDFRSMFSNKLQIETVEVKLALPIILYLRVKLKQ